MQKLAQEWQNEEKVGVEDVDDYLIQLENENN